MVAEKGNRVLIVGGGVSGLSAAHELRERGFYVTLYEERAVVHQRTDEAYGGKARSYGVAEATPVDASKEALSLGRPQLPSRAETGMRYTRSKVDAPADKRSLPGEHGFRFFPAFYRHLPATMATIPFEDGSVADKLVSPGRDYFASYRSGHLIPFLPEFPTGGDVTDLRKLLDGTREIGLSPDDVLHYFACLWKVLTMCKDRRLAELENTTWFEFSGASGRSASFQDYFGVGSTRNLVASRSHEANARIIAEVSIQTWMPILFPRPWNFNDKGDRILKGPTQEVWIGPWLAHLTQDLESKPQVRLHPDRSLVKIELANGLVSKLRFARGLPADETGQLDEASLENLDENTYLALRKPIEDVSSEDFDYVVLALPVEKIARLVDDDLIAAEPDLEHIDVLAGNVRWMSGIQFYLPKIPDAYLNVTGHVNLIDSPWALTAIMQSQSWERPYRHSLNDHDKTQAVLSVCVSDWDAKGFNGHTAKTCSPREIADEVWQQITRALPRFKDVTPVGFALDDDLWERHDRTRSAGFALFHNAEPLLVNTPGSWSRRPRAGTRIQNLVLAGDYVRTNTGLACMEGANESARAAVNEILRRSDSKEPPCEIWELSEPLFAQAAQARDLARLSRGEAWRDVPGSPMSFVVQHGGAVGRFFEYLRDRNPGSRMGKQPGA
ncbi:MAG TPA: FAD-dependent oxidoreductase [Polyangia bacterium]|nr:FAD-dependent oxidoreductase [Polyangia bacterium]